MAHGGAAFVQSLSRFGLIDEYRLVILPVALGAGLPLFKDLVKPLRMDLAEARTFPDGTAIHVYQPITAMGQEHRGEPVAGSRGAAPYPCRLSGRTHFRWKYLCRTDGGVSSRTPGLAGRSCARIPGRAAMTETNAARWRRFPPTCGPCWTSSPGGARAEPPVSARDATEPACGHTMIPRAPVQPGRAGM